VALSEDAKARRPQGKLTLPAGPPKSDQQTVIAHSAMGSFADFPRGCLATAIIPLPPFSERRAILCQGNWDGLCSNRSFLTKIGPNFTIETACWLVNDGEALP
jgi:hypothetical protein